VSAVAIQGICFGFEVHSSLIFRTLRTGQGTPLEVSAGGTSDRVGELVAEWRPRPQNPFHGRLYAHGGRFAFWASDVGWYSIDPSVPSIAVPGNGFSLRREIRMFGIPAALCMMARGDLPIHAGAVEIDGQGVLLAGPGHHGKTTLSAAFARAGYRLLSEDASCCRPGHPPQVFPGAAVLRLRRDVADWMHVPTSRIAIEDVDGAERVHLLMDDSVRGTGDPVPIRAILLLKPGEGRPRLRQVAGVRAVPDLWALTFKLPSDDSRSECFAKLTHLAGGVEILDLERPLSMEGLDRVVQLVADHVREN
jgi:hypothetical protein